MTTPLPLDPAVLLARLTGLSLDRATALLDRAPLGTLVRESPEALETLHDLTPVQAGALHAGLTLGRLTCAESEPLHFTAPRDLAAYLIPRYGHSPVEQFGAVLLNTKNRLLSVRLISSGDLSATVVHPREVLRAAIEARAASIVLFHNHPSGDPSPSADDIMLTSRMVSAGEIMGIAVVDHVIIANQRYFSFKEAGRIPCQH